MLEIIKDNVSLMSLSIFLIRFPLKIYINSFKNVRKNENAHLHQNRKHIYIFFGSSDVQTTC